LEIKEDDVIKNQNIAIMVSGIVAIAFGLLAIVFLGTVLWSSIIIEMVVTGFVFIITYNVLPYTSSELANADALIRRAKFVAEAKADLADITKIRQGYIKIQPVYRDLGAIISTATRTLSDVA
jgi:hypothetical protein